MADMAEFTFAAAAWVGIAAAALLIAMATLALLRQRLVAALIMIAVLGLAGLLAYAWSVSAGEGERQALRTRLSALEAAAWAPGSRLGCLSAAADEALTADCEHSLFADPQTVAAASAFTAARMALLLDAAARAPALEKPVAALRATLELDRYGFVAQLLKQRYGCSAETCATLRVLHDAAKVKAHLRDDTFAQTIARHRDAWQAARAAPVASNPPPEPPQQQRAPLPSTFTLPSADSIPPVSIMDPEPGTTGTAAAAPEPPAPAAPRAPAQHNGRTATPAPMQLGPRP